jgi:hypothetical protein
VKVSIRESLFPLKNDAGDGGGGAMQDAEAERRVRGAKG